MSRVGVTKYYPELSQKYILIPNFDLLRVTHGYSSIQNFSAYRVPVPVSLWVKKVNFYTHFYLDIRLFQKRDRIIKRPPLGSGLWVARRHGAPTWRRGTGPGAPCQATAAPVPIRRSDSAFRSDVPIRRSDSAFRFGVPIRRSDSAFRFGVPIRRSDSTFRFGGPIRRSDSAVRFGVPIRRSDSAFRFGVPIRRFDSAVRFGGPIRRSDSAVRFGGPIRRSDSAFRFSVPIRYGSFRTKGYSTSTSLRGTLHMVQGDAEPDQRRGNKKF